MGVVFLLIAPPLAPLVGLLIAICRGVVREAPIIYTAVCTSALTLIVSAMTFPVVHVSLGTMSHGKGSYIVAAFGMLALNMIISLLLIVWASLAATRKHGMDLPDDSAADSIPPGHERGLLR